MKISLVFIINPISGYGKKDWVENLIHSHLDVDKFNYEIQLTDYAGHARVLADKAVRENVQVVVAVGGDGTINEIVNQLVNTSTYLGIIPLGSGNGLGRHVGIPLHPKKAIENINKMQVEKIDTCTLNGKHFVNVAGAGFDAHISKIFNQGKERGYFSYIKCVISQFNRYQAQRFEVNMSDQSVNKKLLTVAFANSQQYGNNAYVAPLASIKDGWLDVVFIRPFPVWYWPVVIVKTLFKNLHSSSYIETWRGKSMVLKASENFPVHIDGDYFGEEKQLEIKIHPGSLHLIVGKTDI